jgi:hypothetical protein
MTLFKEMPDAHKGYHASYEGVTADCAIRKAPEGLQEFDKVGAGVRFRLNCWS